MRTIFERHQMVNERGPRSPYCQITVCCTGCLLVLLGCCRVSQAQLEYLVTPIAPLSGSPYDRVFAINDDGEAVGESFNDLEGSDEIAFIYANGTSTALGSNYTTATGINDNGEVSGNILGNGTAGGAFAWTAATGIQTIAFNSANAINSNGELAGRGNGLAPAIYINGQITQLGSTGGDAYAINDQGQVVGWNGSAQPFLYTNGQMLDIGTLGGNTGDAEAINNLGQVVGYAQTASENTDAFLYSNGQMTDLGSLNGGFTSAYGINTSGAIVGESSDNAFVYSNGKMSNLNSLLDSTTQAGTVLQAAEAINNKGQIVANGTLNGAATGFLLTPKLVTITTTQTPTIAPPSQHGQLLVFNGANGWSSSVLPQQNENTIVITAGWNLLGGSAPNDWPLQMAQTIAASNPNVNIVTWDWHNDAALSDAGYLVNSEGQGLALALRQELPNYTGDLHFIGHSLGSLVDCQAINTLVSPATGISGSQIDDTILDAPEDIPSFSFLPPGLASNNSNPIPNTGDYAHIDNYITAFGALHSQAENIYLPDELPTIAAPPVNSVAIAQLVENLANFHSSAYTWYQSTIPDGAVQAGYGVTPTAGTYYAQSANPFASPLTLVPLTYDQAEADIVERTSEEYAGGSRVTILASDALNGAVEISGDVIANLETKSQPVAPMASDQLYVSTPAIELNGHGGSYAWIPVSVPQNALGLSFNTLFQDVPPGDSLTIGIGNQVLYTMDGSDAANGTTTSNTVNISQYAGQNVQLFMGLFPGTSTPSAIVAADDLAEDESVTIDGIQFDFQALLGDANGDGIVDAGDLAILNQNLGLSVTGGYADGDFNGDGIVNADDFSLFMEGLAEYQASLALVPEPGAMSLAMACGMLLVRRRRRN